jgi:hypothetical protein
MEEKRNVTTLEEICETPELTLELETVPTNTSAIDLYTH